MCREEDGSDAQLARRGDRNWLRRPLISQQNHGKITGNARRDVMAPKAPQDKDQFARMGETGLTLVSDRTVSWERESIPRLARKPARERLGPVRSGNTRAKKLPEAKK